MRTIALMQRQKFHHVAYALWEKQKYEFVGKLISLKPYIKVLRKIVRYHPNLMWKRPFMALTLLTVLLNVLSKTVSRYYISRSRLGTGRFSSGIQTLLPSTLIEDYSNYLFFHPSPPFFIVLLGASISSSDMRGSQGLAFTDSWLANEGGRTQIF